MKASFFRTLFSLEGEAMYLEIPKVYESERVYLRAMLPSDVHDLFQIFRDARVTNHLLMKQMQSLEEAKKYMKVAYFSFHQQQVPQAMVVVHKDKKKVIGICNCHTIKHDDTGEIGFMLHADYQGRGYMQEIVPIFITLLFEDVGIRRIEVLHDERNNKSKRLIEQVGFVYEGRLREYYCGKNEELLTVLIYSMLKHEWKEQRYEKRISNEV